MVNACREHALEHNDLKFFSINGYQIPAQDNHHGYWRFMNPEPDRGGADSGQSCRVVTSIKSLGIQVGTLL